MKVSDWQKKADEYFPNGVIVTHVTDVPEGNDNTVLLCPKLWVVGLEDGMPVFSTYALNMASDKELTIQAATIDKDEPGLLDVSDPQGQQWILSGNVPAGGQKTVAAALAARNESE